MFPEGPWICLSSVMYYMAHGWNNTLPRMHDGRGACPTFVVSRAGVELDGCNSRLGVEADCEALTIVFAHAAELPEAGPDLRSLCNRLPAFGRRTLYATILSKQL